MKIITPFYQFYRKNFEYIVYNSKPTGDDYHVRYRLFKVENNIEIPITDVVEVGAQEKDVLDFPKEGIYSIHFYNK